MFSLLLMMSLWSSADGSWNPAPGGACCAGEAAVAEVGTSVRAAGTCECCPDCKGCAECERCCPEACAGCCGGCAKVADKAVQSEPGRRAGSCCGGAAGK